MEEVGSIRCEGAEEINHICFQDDNTWILADNGIWVFKDGTVCRMDTGDYTSSIERMAVEMGRRRTMNKEKGSLLWVVLSAFLSIALFFAVHRVITENAHGRDFVQVGVVLDGDESTPYNANFFRATEALDLQYGEHVSIIIRSNVPYEETVAVLRGLCEEGCDIIFTTSYGYGEPAKRMAEEYPEVEFCEATCDNANEEPIRKNFHTFMGEIYQGRYVAGMIAGLKMQEMIDAGQIAEDEAWIGYVGAFPYAEVISGYTAFFLGARQTCPTAMMRVKYTNTWTSYALEKEYAKELIGEGCVIISQHSDTIGPAVECENADAGHPVYHVGYNQDMIDVAPTTSLIGTRIDWSPYFCSAVGAVLHEKRIEDAIPGNIHGNDVGGGFREGWVKMLELNPAIALAGSEELIQRTIEDIQAGRCHVFSGEYLGVNPDDPDDTWDLNTEYQENANASAPSFYYILQNVILVEQKY